MCCIFERLWFQHFCELVGSLVFPYALSFSAAQSQEPNFGSSSLHFACPPCAHVVCGKLPYIAPVSFQTYISICLLITRSCDGGVVILAVELPCQVAVKIVKRAGLPADDEKALKDEVTRVRVVPYRTSFMYVCVRFRAFLFLFFVLNDGVELSAPIKSAALGAWAHGRFMLYTTYHSNHGCFRGYNRGYDNSVWGAMVRCFNLSCRWPSCWS